VSSCARSWLKKQNISLHRAIQKTPYHVVFGKEPNKECHDVKTNDQLPQEESVLKNKHTGSEQVEMENDTPINKTLNENSTMQYKAPRTEQEEFESASQQRSIKINEKKSKNTISHEKSK